MGGKMCAVIGCHNSSVKLAKWKDILCQVHGELHKDCPCLQPYSMHGFPKDTTLRREWVRAINRKDFVPSNFSVVCSKHFLDGAPSKQNRVPQINLGYDRKVIVGRRTVKKVGTAPSKYAACPSEPSQDDLLTVDDPHPNEVNVAHATQRSFSTIGTQWEDFSITDHKYHKITPTMCNKGTQCNFPEYSHENLTESDSVFYTGVKLDIFKCLVNILAAVDTPKYRMPIGDQILLVMIRLRLGLLFADLGRRFKISTCLANNMFNHWLPVMANTLRQFVFWLPRETIQDKMPPSFKELYPRTTCVIDCSEVFIQRTKKLRARAQTFRSYKAHNTAKFLLGIAPHGYVMFISKCYGGRASDKFIVHDSGFLKMLVPGDEVMADKGFTVEEELKALRVGLNIPACTQGQAQLPEEEVTRTRRVGSFRIHVERAIARIKQYRILQFTQNAKEASFSVDNLVMVCAALSNLHEKLIQWNDNLDLENCEPQN